MTRAATTLAMMEALCGHSIPTKTRVRRQSKQTKSVPQGMRNKICATCGHKNKKCTC